MIEEYAVIRLKRVVSTIPLPAGTIGTILIVYAGDPPAYEVEFDTDAGKSLGTYTVNEADLEEVRDS
jgi:hypothetical protein